MPPWPCFIYRIPLLASARSCSVRVGRKSTRHDLGLKSFGLFFKNKNYLVYYFLNNPPPPLLTAVANRSYEAQLTLALILFKFHLIFSVILPTRPFRCSSPSPILRQRTCSVRRADILYLFFIFFLKLSNVHYYVTPYNRNPRCRLSISLLLLFV